MSTKERINKMLKKSECILNAGNTITCPKCHGKGTYKALDELDEHGQWTYKNNKCELCHGTGKITLKFYEDMQKRCREE